MFRTICLSVTVLLFVGCAPAAPAAPAAGAPPAPPPPPAVGGAPAAAAATARALTFDASSSEAVGQSMAKMLQALNEDDRKKFSQTIARETSKQVKIEKRLLQPHESLKDLHGKTAQEIIDMSGNMTMPAH